MYIEQIWWSLTIAHSDDKNIGQILLRKIFADVAEEMTKNEFALCDSLKQENFFYCKIDLSKEKREN